MMKRIFALAVGLTLASTVSVETASAETFTWYMRSTYPYKVYVKFHSQTYSRVWPAARRSWVLDDSRFRTFRLRCNYGELICYGATTRSGRVFWGVGLRNSKRCSTCCSRCNGGSRRITLN